MTLGVVNGGSGVAAATGDGAVAGTTEDCEQDAAAEERASGQIDRRVATALAAAAGHGGEGAAGD